MDDRMLDGDRVLWFIGGSPERAREALAAGRAWTPEQRAQLEQIASSAGYPPQSADYSPPVQAQSPAQSYGVPGGVFAPDGGYGGYSTDSGADYGAPQAPQTPQVQAQPYVEEPPQPQMVTPTQPQPQGFRLQPLPAVTETQPDQGVVQHSDGVPRRGRSCGRPGWRRSRRALALARQGVGGPRPVGRRPCRHDADVAACR